MPKSRTGTMQFGFYLELIEPEITKFISIWDASFLIPRRAVASMARFAAIPELIIKPNTQLHDGAKIAFAKMFCEQPDFFLATMTEMRRLLQRQDKRFLIQRHLIETMISADGKENVWTQKSDAIAFEVSERFTLSGISSEDVRNAEKILRKRLAAPRPEYFRTKDAPAIPVSVVRNAKRPHKIR